MDEITTNMLRDRVWSCVPVTGQAFAALLSLLEVSASEDIPTACVTGGERSTMLLNPRFVARHCRTDEHLAMLVLHELHHVVLGHTRLYPRVTPAQNWAFDCLINAQLCRLFPHPAYTTFFTQFSDEAEGPARLLGPPRGWSPDLPAAIAKRLRRAAVLEDPALGNAHWRLYDDDAITTEELYRLLRASIEEAEPRTGAAAPRNGARSVESRASGTAAGTAAAPGTASRTIGALGTLLGNHTSDEGDSLHPAALREVREIVARWPMVERRSGRDQGRVLERTEVTLGERRAEAVRALRRGLLRAADGAASGVSFKVANSASETVEPFDAGRDRRSAVLRTLGGEPLLHAGTTSSRVPTPRDRVRVYLDLSGSMSGVLAPLYAALAQVLDLVEPRIHGFSTRIGSLSHADLRRGVRLSDGGTDIDAVTGHLLRGRGRRAVIVTDGWVGRIPKDHLRRLRQRGARIVAIVTAKGDPAFATDAGYPAIRLPEL